MYDEINGVNIFATLLLFLSKSMCNVVQQCTTEHTACEPLCEARRAFFARIRAAKPSADAVCGDSAVAMVAVRTPLKCEEKVIDDRRQLVGSFSGGGSRVSGF